MHVKQQSLDQLLNPFKLNSSQTAYIKGRYLGENASLRLILDIFEHCENEILDWILIFLDFEKSNLFRRMEFSFQSFSET